MVRRHGSWFATPPSSAPRDSFLTEKPVDQMPDPLIEKEVVRICFTKTSAIRPPTPLAAVPLSWQRSVQTPTQSPCPPREAHHFPPWAVLGWTRLPMLVTKDNSPASYNSFMRGRARWMPNFEQFCPETSICNKS